jgi:hypothetical protein
MMARIKDRRAAMLGTGDGRAPRVLNRRKVGVPDDAVYVGRPSKWGNPFRSHSRQRNIELYRDWLTRQNRLMDSLHELRGKDLVCWCAPSKCHADVLLRLANEEERR